jgi:shikimate dehydrogenase
MAKTNIIINTSPLGMYPNVGSYPPIPYDLLTPEHLLYDLVYNPLETEFLKRGAFRGAIPINGLQMLHLQADRAWEIWNTEKY